ncbi:MAG: hypothetical protein JWN29_1770 [Acidimicrobiales bacterium]|nr:hypothetical protein [Acidimicrobiales bacterium]
MVAELLLGDDPPPPKRRPRWVDVAGLTAVVGGILAIGIVGDRGGTDESVVPSTTTTTIGRPAPGPQPMPTAATVPTAPISVGRVLTQDTRTTLLVLGQSTPRVFDVDRGILREVAGPTGADAVGVRGAFLFSNPNGLGLLPVDGGPARAFDPEERSPGGPLVAAGPDRVWVTAPSDDGGLTARELGIDSRPTGRQLSLPRGTVVEGAVDDGLVVSQLGSLTFIDAEGGRGVDLGPGAMVATNGRTLARLACRVLRCQLELVDPHTGRSAAVEGLPPVARASGTFSASGRWLAALVVSGNDRGFLVVIDVVNHRVGPGIDSGDAFAFAAYEEVLFVVEASRLRAYDLPSATRHDFSDLVLPAAQRLVAAPTG